MLPTNVYNVIRNVLESCYEIWTSVCRWLFADKRRPSSGSDRGQARGEERDEPLEGMDEPLEGRDEPLEGRDGEPLDERSDAAPAGHEERERKPRLTWGPDETAEFSKLRPASSVAAAAATTPTDEKRRPAPASLLRRCREDAAAPRPALPRGVVWLSAWQPDDDGPGHGDMVRRLNDVARAYAVRRMAHGRWAYAEERVRWGPASRVPYAEWADDALAGRVDEHRR